MEVEEGGNPFRGSSCVGMRSAGVAGPALARPSLAIPAGALIGAVVTVSLALELLLPIALLLAALIVLLPALLVRDAKLYWLSVFLFALQFDVKKTLVDGLAILRTLQLDAQPWVFVPEIRLSDLPFLALLVLWANDLRLKKTRLHVPGISWLALGFLGWAALSLAWAPSRYLAALELLRQCKFFLVALYAANAVESKRTLKRMWLILLLVVLVQGGTTIFRFTFDYYGSFFGDLFGRTEVPEGREEEVLLIDPYGESGLGGLRNSFGTIMSAGATSQLLLLVLPLAAFACMPNAVFRRRFACALIFAAGGLGFVLTFSRSSMIGCVAALALGAWFTVRRGYISRTLAPLLCLGLLALLATGAPMVGHYFTRKSVNVTVRFEQYETAMSMIRANPLLGVGLNNSVVDARRYGEFSHSLIDVSNQVYETPIHSFYLALLVEVGVVGFLLYMSMFVWVGWKAWRLVEHSADPEAAFSALVILLGLIGLGVGVLTNALFEDGVETLVYFYAGVILSLERRAGAAGESASRAPEARARPPHQEARLGE
jgi:O-Antigen ligase